MFDVISSPPLVAFCSSLYGWGIRASGLRDSNKLNQLVLPAEKDFCLGSSTPCWHYPVMGFTFPLQLSLQCLGNCFSICGLLCDCNYGGGMGRSARPSFPLSLGWLFQSVPGGTEALRCSPDSLWYNRLAGNEPNNEGGSSLPPQAM